MQRGHLAALDDAATALLGWDRARPRLPRELIERLQLDSFADDLPVDVDRASLWTEAQLQASGT